MLFRSVALTNTTTLVQTVGESLTLNGSLSGPGGIVVNGTAGYPSLTFSGDQSAFTGTFTENNTSAFTRLKFNSTGGTNATYVFNNTSIDAEAVTVGTNTVNMGALLGTGILRQDAVGLTTLSIGGLNTNETWGGILQQGGSGNLFAVLKVGMGIVTFTNNNTYTGLNEVAAGTFEITSVQQTAQPLQVDDGATFGFMDTGSGQSAQLASIELGTNGPSGGNLFFTNIYAGGVAPISISGGLLTNNGVCTVTLADTANLSAGNIYALVSYGTYSGSGRFVLAPLPGVLVGGLINDPSSGGLLLSLPLSTTRTNITTTVTTSGGVTTLDLAWPSDHQGWVLETNNVGLNVSDAWGVVSGSEYTTGESFTVDPTQTNVFFRLVLP